MIKDIILLAFKNVKKRGLRSLLTMIQIMLGIATITIIFNLIFNIWDGINHLEGEMGGRVYLMNVITERAPDAEGRIFSQHEQLLTPQTLEQIEELSTVEYISPIDSVWEPLLKGQEEFFRLQKMAYVGPNYREIFGIDLEEGTFFTPQDYQQQTPVGLISRTAARLIFPHQSPIGEEVKIYQHWRSGDLPTPQILTIIGVFSSEGMEEQFSAVNGNQLLVPATLNISHPTTIIRSSDGMTIMESMEEKSREIQSIRFHNIALKIKEGSYQETLTAITRQVQDTFGDQYQIQLSAYARFVESLRDWARIISLILSGFGFLIVIISSTGILSTMMVGILERTTHIGLEKAMGAPGKFVFLRFTTEAFLISLGGWVLGILLALLLAESISQLGTFLPVPITGGIHPLAALLALLVALFSGGIFSIYPALQATRMDPVEAIRYG